jgi:hypothetical protein
MASQRAYLRFARAGPIRSGSSQGQWARRASKSDATSKHSVLRNSWSTVAYCCGCEPGMPIRNAMHSHPQAALCMFVARDTWSLHRH